MDSVSDSIVRLLAVVLNALCREAGCLEEAKLLSGTQPVQVSRWMWHRTHAGVLSFLFSSHTNQQSFVVD